MQAARNMVWSSGMERHAKQRENAREPSCRCAAQRAYGTLWGRRRLLTNAATSIQNSTCPKVFGILCRHGEPRPPETDFKLIGTRLQNQRYLGAPRQPILDHSYHHVVSRRGFQFKHKCGILTV